MLDVMDELPKQINTLIYIQRGLHDTEINYIGKTFKVNALRMIINLRYAPDPKRYDGMKKKELLNELKFTRYDE